MLKARQHDEGSDTLQDTGTSGTVVAPASRDSAVRGMNHWSHQRSANSTQIIFWWHRHQVLHNWSQVPSYTNFFVFSPRHKACVAYPIMEARKILNPTPESTETARKRPFWTDLVKSTKQFPAYISITSRHTNSGGQSRTTQGRIKLRTARNIKRERCGENWVDTKTEQEKTREQQRAHIFLKLNINLLNKCDAPRLPQEMCRLKRVVN